MGADRPEEAQDLDGEEVARVERFRMASQKHASMFVAGGDRERARPRLPPRCRPRSCGRSRSSASQGVANLGVPPARIVGCEFQDEVEDVAGFARATRFAAHRAVIFLRGKLAETRSESCPAARSPLASSGDILTGCPPPSKLSSRRSARCPCPRGSSSWAGDSLDSTDSGQTVEARLMAGAGS
jgi:hypothetical protein